MPNYIDQSMNQEKKEESDQPIKENYIKNEFE